MAVVVSERALLAASRMRSAGRREGLGQPRMRLMGGEAALWVVGGGGGRLALVVVRTMLLAKALRRESKENMVEGMRRGYK